MKDVDWSKVSDGNEGFRDHFDPGDPATRDWLAGRSPDALADRHFADRTLAQEQALDRACNG